MDDRIMYRVAGWGAILGGLLGIAVNAFNPLRPDSQTLADPTAPLDAASSGSWEAIQVGVLVAFLLFLAAFYAVSHSIKDSPARGWARFGFGAAFLGIGLSVAGFAIYAGLGNAIQALGTEAVVAAAVVASGLLTASEIVLFGVGGLLYGIALGYSESYPTWLGAMVAAAGIAGLISGFMDAFIGPTTITNFVLFPISSGLLILAVIYAGVLLLRRFSAPITGDEEHSGVNRHG